MNWRKSVLLKKAVRYGFDALRFPYRYILSDKDYLSRPPILANSFPKSGTHLLIQILQALPGIRDWGGFLASTPSFTFREIPQKRMCRRIQRLIPNELVSGHLYYSDDAEKALAEKNVAHYFVYRDPRDIVVSEAHYLTYMNKWHRLHPHFKALPDMRSRILFSIKGATEKNFQYDYPDIRRRFDRYKQWINNSHVISLRFEDLIRKERDETVRRIITGYLERGQSDLDQKALLESALGNIDPTKSHTFRKGKSGGWRDVFTDMHKEAFKDRAGNLLIELGYEHDLRW